MLTNRQLFLQHLGQTSVAPMMLEIVRAEGIYMYGPDGKKYIDLISGVSVSNTGHCHPRVVEAVKNQVDKYMHLMVYGEFIQNPQVKYAERLAEILPPSLNSCYFVNSGSEAVEGALKLAKRFTGRTRFMTPGTDTSFNRKPSPQNRGTGGTGANLTGNVPPKKG